MENRSPGRGEYLCIVVAPTAAGALILPPTLHLASSEDLGVSNVSLARRRSECRER
jgi:hypothetical protein